jgi:hypothetical protein
MVRSGGRALGSAALPDYIDGLDCSIGRKALP